MKVLKKLATISACLSSMWACSPTIVFAHVAVTPAQVQTAAYQTFTVGVPNEKDQPFTTLKIVMPDSLSHVMPTVKSGWQVSTEKEGTGEAAKVTSITYSNGSVPAGMREEFSFSAQAPSVVGELQWKAYQTYQDGTVVSWDKAETTHTEDNHKEEAESENSGPFSVTKVVATTEDTAKNNSDTATTFYRMLTIIALFISLFTISYVTKQPRK